MTTRTYWEKELDNLKDSYTHTTAKLAYLDLETLDKVTHKQLAHNLKVHAYRTDLGAKVCLYATHRSCDKVISELREDNIKLQKDIKKQKTEIVTLQGSIQKLEVACEKIHSEVLHLRHQPKPLTSKDVERLVLKISEQPKFIEQQTEALIEALTVKVNKVEELIRKLEREIFHV